MLLLSMPSLPRAGQFVMVLISIDGITTGSAPGWQEARRDNVDVCAA